MPRSTHCATPYLSQKPLPSLSVITSFLLLLVLAPVAWAQQPAPALPPPPDSLRPLLLSARTEAARQAAWLRTAAAYVEVADSAGTVAYALAAQTLAARRRDSVGVGRALSLRGYLMLQLGDYPRAAPLLHRAERLLAAAALTWQADNHSNLAWLLGDTDQPGPALRYLRQAYAEYGRVGNQAGQAVLSGTATAIYLFQGRGDSAVYVLLRAARQQQRLGLNEAEATTLSNLATVLHQLDRLPEAEHYARQALATMLRLHDDVNLPPLYQTLGNIAWARHRPAEAVPYYRTCIKMLRRQHREGLLVSCYGSLAGALSDLGQGDSAVYYQTRAVRLCQQLGQTTQLAIEMSSLAAIYGKQHRWSEAEQWAKASLVAQGDKLLQNTRALFVLERVAEARGDFREALRLERQIRHADDARAARESQKQVQEQRARFDTDRAEQQVTLLQARAQLLANAQELTRLRARQQVAGLGALTLLAVALAVGFIWQYRRRQARREAALRQQIAADLHDDVGSLLTQISLQSELMTHGLHPPDEQQAQLVRMAEASRTAVRHMSDVVWGLSEPGHAGTLGPLLERMREHAHEVLPPAGLEVDFATDPALETTLMATEGQQALFLIFKEALHNAVKHARDATQVQVQVQQTPSGLHLVVVDNGHAASETKPTGTPLGGHGLRNMQARAQAMGGTVAYQPKAPGFEVSAKLPLR